MRIDVYFEKPSAVGGNMYATLVAQFGDESLYTACFPMLEKIAEDNGLVYDADGKEITGPERSIIDTQQQSFFGIMNIIRSKTKPVILNPMEYFVCPNWGHHPIFGEINHDNEYNGWDINMKSKIIHFIGHTVFNGVYYRKAKVFNDFVDKYIKENNLI
jgi:hypothetical protein